MRRRLPIRAAALVGLVAGLLAACTGVTVDVPTGTKVGLKFLTPVASKSTNEGAKVAFNVAADVIQDPHVIIRSGASATGTVTQVTRPGSFGTNAKVVVGFITVQAVDGKPIKLNDVIVSKEMVDKNRAGAAGASVAGAIVLGPIGLLAGALVRGDDVEVPAGTVVTAATSTDVTVKAR